MAANNIPAAKYRYKNEQFDALLTELLANITEEQKASLPADLQYKIFKSKDPNVNGLSDAQKDYILNTAFNKQIIKFIMDADKGFSIAQFEALRDSWRGKKNSGVNNLGIAEQMAFNGEMVLAGRDLYEGLSYAALLFYQPIMKLALSTRKAAKKYKSVKPDFKIGIETFINIFVQYESYKKRLVTEFGLADMSDWYCLIYFYSKERRGSSIYTEKFKYSYSTSVQGLKAAVTRLKHKGLLLGRGAKKNHMISITPTGQAMVDKILVKYILNY